MKIFLDTVDVGSISELLDTGMIDGITTNPMLLSKSERPYKELLQEICRLVDGPVSIEVLSTDAGEMVTEGISLAKIADNVVVKLPMTMDGIRACTALTKVHKIKVNVTLCFSIAQAMLAAKAGAYFISPFMGRVDDIGSSGSLLVKEIRELYTKHNFSTKVLAASVRSTKHVMDAAIAGVDIATVPVAVFKQLFMHPMTDRGLGEFLSAWEKAGKEIA